MHAHESASGEPMSRLLRSFWCLRLGLAPGDAGREVDEFTAIAEKWGYWSNGVGELLSFCPDPTEQELEVEPRQ